MPTPKKGVAYTLTRALFSTATPGAFQVNPTIAVGDFQVSKDGGAFANLTNLPTVVPSGSRWVQFVLTATEMTADRVTLQGVDQAGGEWGDFGESFDTTLNTLDDLVVTAGRVHADVKAIDASVVGAQNLGKSTQVIYPGAVTGAATATTLIDSGLTQSDPDHWKGRLLLFLTGSLKYQGATIVAFTPATDTLTFTTLTVAPNNGDQYVIL